MGIWDSIKGGAGAAWDHTGGKLAAVPSNAWDAHQRANEEGRIFGLNPDKGLYQGLEGVADFAEGYGNLLYDTSPMGVTTNLAGWLPGQWQETADRAWPTPRTVYLGSRDNQAQPTSSTCPSHVAPHSPQRRSESRRPYGDYTAAFSSATNIRSWKACPASYENW